MSVGAFDPAAMQADLDVELVRELLALIGDGEDLTFDRAQQLRFAPLLTHSGWADHAASFSVTEVESLIRAFTLGEERFESWMAGEKSAVVPLVRSLKKQGAYDKQLTRWIKDHSSNKFLPHGNLMDRL